MNQPSAEIIKLAKENGWIGCKFLYCFQGSSGPYFRTLETIHIEEALKMDWKPLFEKPFDKTEPIPGAVRFEQIEEVIGHGGMIEVYKAAERVENSFDIYPKGTVARLMGEVEELKREELTLGGHLTILKSKNKDLQAEIDRLKGEVEELKRKLENGRKRFEAKESSLEYCSDFSTKQANEIKDLKTEVDRLKFELAMEESANMVAIKKLDAEIDRLKSQQKPESVGCGGNRLVPIRDGDIPVIIDGKAVYVEPCPGCPDCQAKADAHKVNIKIEMGDMHIMGDPSKIAPLKNVQFPTIPDNPELDAKVKATVDRLNKPVDEKMAELMTKKFVLPEVPSLLVRDASGNYPADLRSVLGQLIECYRAVKAHLEG